VYNASNNELVRTKTLVKNCIVQVDCLPFRQWYESHYGLPIGRKKTKKEAEAEDDVLTKKRSNHLQHKLANRKAQAKVDPHVEDQFLTGRLYACIASRPGQCGRCDGYVLEGKELEFYLRKLKSKKTK